MPLISSQVRYAISSMHEALTWLVLSGLIGFVVGDLFLFQAFAIVGARVSMLYNTTL
jgi:hypothetical protein